MLPRYTSDYRTLLWALVLFPALPAAGYAWPSALPWLLPLLAYASYSAGVLTHNHTHVPVFRARWANELYGMWLSVFYGCPVAFWIPTHLQNHHRFVGGPGDVTQTSRHSVEHGLYPALAYSLLCARWQRPLVIDYVRRAYARRGRQWASVRNQCAALALGHAGLLGAAVALHGSLRGLLIYGVCAALPALLAPIFMFFTNYIQHVECDPASPDAHSRNFVGALANWFVFDAGYHTIHHERPSVHWSRYAALHAARAASIHPSLCQRYVLGFCLKSYVLGALGARSRPRPASERVTPAARSRAPRGEGADEAAAASIS